MAGWLTGIEDERGYRPPLFHRLFRGRISGNDINGLGETTPRRPRPVYHDQGRWHPWRIVQDAFYVRVSLRGFWPFVMASDRLDRRRPAPVASVRVEDTPHGWSARVKRAALEIGADDAGIARVDPEWVFEGEEVREPWIVVLASRMDYGRLAATIRRDFRTGLGTVMETYYRGHETATKLADWIRAQGWHAKGYGSPRRTPVNLLPAAIAAGLGELGKHGSLIHPRLGSCFRLAYVLTELPLTDDRPAEFGADDFCASCQLCTRECPPEAISDRKQLVRGVERWYVDFDRCVPYFNDNYGCGLCLAVCPWSRPGVAERLAAKMQQRREARTDGARTTARDHPNDPP
ncbi:MAG: 4Fe-4S dicluster domain-containing protein [Candidatus Binatia bacterium]